MAFWLSCIKVGSELSSVGPQNPGAFRRATVEVPLYLSLRLSLAAQCPRLLPTEGGLLPPLPCSQTHPETLPLPAPLTLLSLHRLLLPVAFPTPLG